MDQRDIIEEVLCKKDVAITELNLLKIQVVKKKNLDQVRTFHQTLIESDIPDEIGVVGFWMEKPKDSVQTYEYILFTYGNLYKQVQLGKIDLHHYAYRVLSHEQPELIAWQKGEKFDDKTRQERYKVEKEAIEKTVKRLKNTLPQLFTV